MQQRTYTPLRWAGSKKRIIPFLIERCPAKFFRYYEPFAGSAVLFFHLMPRFAVLGDFNSDLIGFYRALRRSPEELHHAASSFSLNRETYVQVRSEFHSMVGFERAARFWYLNRCCFNGIYRTSKSGKFNVPFGSKLPPFPEAGLVGGWASLLHRADLLDTDFKQSVSSASEGDFIYMDPPYARAGLRDRGEYGPNALQPEHIGRVVGAALAASGRGAKVMISYNENISDLLVGWRSELVNVRRDIAARAANRGGVNEYVYRNY